jgi:signal transduction histidine kinase
MGSAALRSVASARLLVGVTLAVVVAFVASTAISERIASRSAANTDDIIGNAMPSVQMLSLIRGDLRTIDRYLRDRAWMTSEQLTRSDAAQLRNIDAALASYTSLPFFPGEHDLYAPIPGLLSRLETQLATASPTSTDAAVDVFDQTIDDIDHTLERIETYDATQGQRLGLAIARTRSDSRSLIFLLDAATAVLAIIAVTLAVRVRRRAIRALIDETNVAQESLADLRTRVDELGHFAGRVAHDIRNPLQTALLSLEIIRQSSPEAAASVARGVGALRRMNRLVDDLLEFARAGGKPLPNASTDMGAVVREVVEGLATEAAAARVEVAAETVANARVPCASGVMQSIVANLVRNAITHMGEAVERKVSVRISEAGARWRLEVQDTGPGIPPGHEQRIFEPHVQLDPVGSGIGLGLATVARLVNGHQGAFGVVSPPGCGAVFWVELPKLEA